jgi:hypothetical protein
VPKEFSFLAIPGALNVKQLDLSQINAEELDYFASAKFPNTAIGQQHYDRLKKSGWKSCKGVPIGWSTYEDDSQQGISYCVWSTREYFAKDGKTMNISQEYTEPRKSGMCPANPASTNLQVMVTVYENSTTDDVKRMGLMCEGSSP